MGIIESCYGPYQNRQYLIKNSTPGKYWLVNVKVELNRINIRDVNLPTSINKFSEKFAGCTISFFINFFSAYDYVELNKKSRDLLDFMTSLDLMKMTTLPQGATNFVAQFVRIALKVLSDHLHN